MNKKSYIWVFGIICTALLIFGGIWFFGAFESNSSRIVMGEQQPKTEKQKMKKARGEYFFRMLRDPATNEIPSNIRSRELAYAKKLPSRSNFLSKGQSGQAIDMSWALAGPQELGGRTRALAIDQRNSDIIIAGGVSGGIWKSIDGGNSWEMKTNPNQNMSVTSVAQDPTNPDVWYYASGEFRGNSASDRSYSASYFGTGIFKSTDNGETWSRLSATKDTDTNWNSQYDYISRIVVNPTNGDVYFASNGVGVYKSTDGGSSFTNVLGELGAYRYTDVVINKEGDILAAVSENAANSSGEQPRTPGLYLSTDDGSSWTDVTPSDFPSTHDRTYLAFAPSASDTAYSLTYEGTGEQEDEEISFFMLDMANDTTYNRSENLPDFGSPVGFVNTQSSYNMVVAVKPDDPDFVLLGTTNLFRSRDGFATAPADDNDDGFSDASEQDEYWIGGYDNDNSVSLYPGQHPDQHAIVFDPNDPNKMWSGHDGGLSLTTDITASPVTWQDKDEGYITGQFYTVDIPSAEGDDRILGGAQDNGTPFFRADAQGNQQNGMEDISFGDGSYGFFTENYIFVSTQMGNIQRKTTDSNGDITGTIYNVEPSRAENQLFIHPYALDPNDEGIMFYPGVTDMWRNTTVDENPNTGWSSFSAASNSHQITTLEVSTAPSGILYYGASANESAPKIYRLDNASSSTSYQELAATGAPSGAYVHDIAVNPNNGDEVIAVMSNYNIVGLYRSTDGGGNWTAVEGNLQGDSEAGNPGPSIRNATILPTSEGTVYLVGTSTGVYSTTTFDGSSTTWVRESDDGSPESIGYSVIEHIDSRPLDGKIAVGTHGRGIFVGQTNVAGVQPPIVLDINNTWQLVGSPVASTSEVTLGDGLTMFGFSGTYESASEMEPQTGYWVKSRTGSQIQFSSNENTSATIALEEGWNIIGGITEDVPVSNINDPNNIRSSAPIYRYNSGAYEEASEIKSGQGYWIHANEAGEIQISASGSSSGKNYLADIPNGTSRIKFRSGRAAQTFLVSQRSLDQNDRNRFRMPPKSPEPLIDVRTSEGFRLAEGKSTTIELTAASYPVSVTVPNDFYSDLMLKGVTGKDTVSYDLTSGTEISIQRPHEKLLLEKAFSGNQITKHNLLPNYPNPFNPTTKIRYEVASQAEVRVEVYDVLGRKVRTLVNQQQPRGAYTVQFDGSNLSSGTYFIHLKAGNTAKVQKMTLIK